MFFDIGVDTPLHDDLITCVSLALNTSSFDMNDSNSSAEDDGTYTVNIITVNPYVSWAPRENLSLWGAVGYGRGETKFEQDGDSSATRDGDFTSIAGGGRFEVWHSAAGRSLAIQLDGSTTSFLDADAQRVRFAGEISQSTSLESGLGGWIGRATLTCPSLVRAVCSYREARIAVSGDLVAACATAPVRLERD